MSGTTNINRRTLRRQETIREIVDAAWELSRLNGLGNFSMRELGAHVGMRAQSLYSYFSSKNEIFDAMFLDGNRQFLEHMHADHHPSDEPDPEALTRAAHRFVDFCTSDPVRYLLLFQRTIPDFEPSPESYAVAQEAYEIGFGELRELGLSDEELDLCSAVMSGIAAQQIANDPGGDRFERHVPRLTEMLLRELAPSITTTTAANTRSQT